MAAGTRSKGLTPAGRLPVEPNHLTEQVFDVQREHAGHSGQSEISSQKHAAAKFGSSCALP